jgi:hypothetical protein
MIHGRAAEGAINEMLHGHDVRAGAILRMEITGALPFATVGADSMNIIITFECDRKMLERDAPRLIRVAPGLFKFSDHAGMHLTASCLDAARSQAASKSCGALRPVSTKTNHRRVLCSLRWFVGVALRLMDQ